MLFPENIAEDDEAFWRQQELRRQQLGQPCCTQSNMSWAMVDLVGNVSVVIHGESDCLNCFFHHQGRLAVDYYSTRLSEHQLIMGDTRAPLRRLLELIAKERRPEVVIVLGTCPVEVIYDDFEPVVRAVSQETGVPMIALRTHGLSLTSQIACQDWLYATLAGFEPPDAGAQRRGVNLVGLPAGVGPGELTRVLGELGIAVNGVYPNQKEFAHWRRIGLAERSFMVDRTTLPRLCAVIEEHGQRVDEVPLPIGLYHTERFYGLIASRMGVDDERVAACLRPLIEEHAPAHRALRERVRGRRLALCIRMHKSHQSDLLAYEGLTSLELLRGAGFDVHILVQGPPEERARRSFAGRLAELGYGDVPFDIFRGPWELGEQLRIGGFDVAVMSDFARNVVERAGIPWISIQRWQPLFSGMAENLRMLNRAVDQMEP
ncbi:MAG: hypothetical protein KC593_00165 [Myxococcales bacterium]|nr:hypothetical protein [Myxococcales bacterium]MCB9627466.1 hypothetical protein [Sandaracinaceae bacterium]